MSTRDSNFAPKQKRFWETSISFFPQRCNLNQANFELTISYEHRYQHLGMQHWYNKRSFTCIIKLHGCNCKMKIFRSFFAHSVPIKLGFARSSTAKHFLNLEFSCVAPPRGTWITAHNWKMEILTHNFNIKRHFVYHCSTTAAHIILIRMHW